MHLNGSKCTYCTQRSVELLLTGIGSLEQTCKPEHTRPAAKFERINEP